MSKGGQVLKQVCQVGFRVADDRQCFAAYVRQLKCQKKLISGIHKWCNLPATIRVTCAHAVR